MIIPPPPSSFTPEQRTWLGTLIKGMSAEFTKNSQVGVPISIPPQLPDTSYNRIDRMTLAVDTTLREDEVNTHLYVNCTSDKALTLPVPGAGMWLTLFNVGTNKITLKTDGGTTITPPILTGGQVNLYVQEDASAVAAWQTGIVVVYPSGAVVVGGALTVYTKDKFYLTSPDGTKWQVLIDNAGAVTYVTTGSSDPVIS